MKHSLLPLLSVVVAISTLSNLLGCGSVRDFPALVADYANASETDKKEILDEAMVKWKNLNPGEREKQAQKAAQYLYDHNKESAFEAVIHEMDREEKSVFRTGLMTVAINEAHRHVLAIHNASDIPNDPKVVHYLQFLKKPWVNIAIEDFKTSDGDKNSAFFIVDALFGQSDEQTRTLLELAAKAIKDNTDAVSISWKTFTKDGLKQALKSLGSEVWARRVFGLEITPENFVHDAKSLSDADTYLDKDFAAFLTTRAGDEGELAKAMKEFSHDPLRSKMITWILEHGDSETALKAFNTTFKNSKSILALMVKDLLARDKAKLPAFLNNVGPADNQWNLDLSGNVTINGQQGTLLYAIAKNLDLTHQADRDVLRDVALALKTHLAPTEIAKWQKYVNEGFGAPGHENNVLQLLQDAHIAPNDAKALVAYGNLGAVLAQKDIIKLLKKAALTNGEKDSIVNYIVGAPNNEKFTDVELPKFFDTIVSALHEKSKSSFVNLYTKLLDNKGREVYLTLALDNIKRAPAIKDLLGEIVKADPELHLNIRNQIFGIALTHDINNWAFLVNTGVPTIKNEFKNQKVARLTGQGGDTYGVTTAYGESDFTVGADQGTLIWKAMKMLIKARDDKKIGNGGWKRPTTFGYADQKNELREFVRKVAKAIKAVTVLANEEQWKKTLDSKFTDGKTPGELLIEAPRLFDSLNAANTALGY
jgi:hypothetical protein